MGSLDRPKVNEADVRSMSIFINYFSFIRSTENYCGLMRFWLQTLFNPIETLAFNLQEVKQNLLNTTKCHKSKKVI